VSGARCRLGNQRTVDLIKEGGKAVAMVRRDRFDLALAVAAGEAGAEIRDSVKVLGIEEDCDKVTVNTSSGACRASYVVGADGALGVTSKSLGLKVRGRFNPAVEAELIPASGSVAPEFKDIALYDMGAVRGGYAWIFPKRDHYSVGLCSTYSKVKNVKSLYNDFIEATPFLKECKVRKLSGWVIPLGAKGGKIASSRCLLTGDAAGCVDPLTGEGIYYAMRTGAIAASCIKEKLVSGAKPGLEAYQRAVKKEIFADLNIGKWFAKLYYLFPSLAFKILLKDKRVVRHYFSLLSGDIDYKTIAKLALKSGWRLRLRR